MKFAKLMAYLGIASTDTDITEAHMTSAETKIAELEKAASDAELAKKAAEDKLLEASGQLTTAKADLETAQTNVKTLEDWKKEQKAVDGSAEDESNRGDEEPAGSAASFETVAANAIASAKKRVG